MKTHAHIFRHDDWDLPRWFAILSPLIGVLVGLLGLFILAR
jgi:hypothetical protein